MGRKIEHVITSIAVPLFIFGNFLHYAYPANEQHHTPFSDTIINFTEVQSASQAAAMFNINLEKRAANTVAVGRNYVLTDQSGWSVIDL